MSEIQKRKGYQVVKGLNGKTYEESHIRSEGDNPLTKYVNLCQSPEERRDKYNFCRSFGVTVSVATAMRDWHWTKINLYLYAFTHPYQLELLQRQ